MILDAGAQGTTAASTLNFASGSDAGSRTWNVKVTQIPCNSDTLWVIYLTYLELVRITFVFRAPSGCTQYFTALAGTVFSYNYAGQRLLQSQNYGTCIRQCTGAA